MIVWHNRGIIIFVALISSSLPVGAQTAAIFESRSPELDEEIPVPGDVETASMPVGVTALPPTSWTIKAGFAPGFSRNDLAQRGDRLSDLKNTSSLSLNLQKNFSKRVVFSGKMGLNWDSDFEAGDDEPDASAFVASAKLIFDRGRRRLSPFISYQFDWGRKNFLGSFDYTDHTLSLGVDFVVICARDTEKKCTTNAPGKFKLSPSLDRVYSAKEERERTTPRLKGSYDLTFYKGLKLSLIADYQWRRFDHIASFPRREQHRFLGEGSIDFAGLFNEHWKSLDTLTLGVRYSYADAQGTADDLSKADFLPSINLKFNL